MADETLGRPARLLMDDGEKKALADIEAYGCHVIHVLEDNDDPPFSYSVGVGKTSGAPEVIVIGLKQPIAHFIVNEYNDEWLTLLPLPG